MNAMAVQTRARGTDQGRQSGRGSGRRVLVAAWILVVALAAILLFLSVRMAGSNGMLIARDRTTQPMPTPMVIPGPH